MKKRRGPYRLGALVIFGILTALTLHTMDTFSTQQTTEKTTPSVKRERKKCGCCSKHTTQIKEQIRTAQERKAAKEHDADMANSSQQNTTHIVSTGETLGTHTEVVEIHPKAVRLKTDGKQRTLHLNICGKR